MKMFELIISVTDENVNNFLKQQDSKKYIIKNNIVFCSKSYDSIASHILINVLYNSLCNIRANLDEKYTMFANINIYNENNIFDSHLYLLNKYDNIVFKDQDFNLKHLIVFCENNFNNVVNTCCTYIKINRNNIFNNFNNFNKIPRNWKYKIIVTYTNKENKNIIENYNTIFNKYTSLSKHNDVFLDEKMNVLINKKNKKYLTYINNKQKGLLCLHINKHKSYINRISNYLPSNLIKIIFKHNFNKDISNFPNNITYLNLGLDYVKKFMKIPFKIKEIIHTDLSIYRNIKTKFNKIKFTIIKICHDKLYYN